MLTGFRPYWDLTQNLSAGVKLMEPCLGQLRGAHSRVTGVPEDLCESPET